MNKNNLSLEEKVDLLLTQYVQLQNMIIERFTVQERETAALRQETAALRQETAALRQETAALRQETAAHSLKLDSLDERMLSLEAKVDERLQDTRPMWQVIHAQTERIIEQITQIETRMIRIEERFDVIQDDMGDLRVVQKKLNLRVSDLERERERERRTA
jgi:predicted  nucleic acid-binding Zn-ribbon protein